MDLLSYIILGTVGIVAAIIFFMIILPTLTPKIRAAKAHARGELTDEEKRAIADEVLVEPAPVKLKRHQKRRADRITVITTEMGMLTFAYKTFPHVFKFRGKLYYIYPHGVITVRTKWRKIALYRQYIIVENDMIPVMPDPSKATIKIPLKDSEGNEIVDTDGKLVYMTNWQILDFINGIATEKYTQSVYGASQELLTQDKIIFFAFGLVTGLAVLGIFIGIHGGAI